MLECFALCKFLPRAEKWSENVFDRAGKGVEYQKISTEKFNTIGQADKFLKSGGKILACGTCIKSRNQEGTEVCPINTMKDMYEIVKESDKIVTF